MVSAAAAYTLAILPSWVQPYLIMELITDYDMNEASAGAVVTAEATAIAMTSVICAGIAAHYPYFRTLLSGVILIAVGNCASIVIETFLPLLAARIVSGIGAGILLMVATAAIAGFKDSDRAYGQINCASVLSGLALYGIVPVIVASGVSHITFIVLLIFVIVLLPSVLAMPKNLSALNQTPSGRQSDAGFMSRDIVLIAMGVILSCSILASIWAFYFVLGDRAGLSAEDVNTVMIYVVVCALIATLLVSFDCQRYGRLAPLLLAIAIMTVSIVCLGLSQNPVIFRVFTGLNIFGLYLFVPYFLGYAAAVDPSGRGAAIVSGVYLAGTSIGPYLGGIVMSSLGVEFFAWIALCVNGISIALFFLVNSRLENRFK
jgi:predicted MFS family arabinose efflux permease